MDTIRSSYDQMGGADAVRTLVDRFYDLMDSRPEASGIRALHAKCLRALWEKLYLFLSGWLGGPDLYQQKYGHPMLRRRHLPFPIGVSERDQWMHCMEMALNQTEMDDELRAHLKRAFFQTADHMRNRPEHGQSPELKITGVQVGTE